MKDLPINFNTQVTVTLTDFGVTQRAHYYHALGMEPPKKRTVTQPLWELFAIHGPGVHMGMQAMPFVDNTFTLHLED